MSRPRRARVLPGLALAAAVLASDLAASAPREQREPPAPQAPTRLTLTEAIDLARGDSPTLARFRALEDAATAAEMEARAERGPLVDAKVGYTRRSGVPELAIPLPDGTTRVLFPDIPDVWNTRLGVSLPLYAGGRLSAIEEAASYQALAARGERRTAAADVVLEAVSAYWNLVTARDTVRVLREALASYEGHLRDARNRKSVGMAARNEVLAVQVERDRAELVRLQAENAAAVFEADLVRILGLPPSGQIDPTEPMTPPREGGELPEDLAREALGARPERDALRARISAADSLVEVERAALRPRAAASAGFEYANPNSRILPLEERWQESWDVSLGVSFTLFDSGRARAAVARANARADAARHEMEDLDGRIRLEVTARRLDLGTALARIEVAERNLTAAEENRRVAHERYREGVAPSSELLDAETALLSAGLDRTQALASAQLARAALDRALGRLR